MKLKVEAVLWLFSGLILGSVLAAAILGGAADTVRAGIEVSQAALASVIALLAAYIAYRQVRNDELRRRLELYDRRQRIYQGITSFLLRVAQDVAVTDDDLRELNRATSEGFFLFGEKFELYVKELHKKAVRLKTIHSIFERRTSLADPERERLSDEQSAILTWVGEQFKDSRRLFADELRLE